MTDQRRIDLLFTAAVVAVRTGRAARRAGPAAAMMLMIAVAVHGTLGGTDESPVQRLAAEPPAGWAVHAVPPAPVVVVSIDSRPPTLPAEPVAAVDADAEPASLPDAGRELRSAPPPVPAPVVAPVPAPVVAPVVAAAPTRVAPALDREQQNIARFIAQRYRVTFDSTSEFVHHAYRAARDIKLDPMLVLAVMSVESSFNPTAQSHAGAQGLMQVLTRVHVEKFLPFGGIPAAFDPVANIRVGSAILKEYLQREGSVEGALKSYVGAALAEHDGGYGRKVLNARERIAAAAAGRPIPPEVSVRAAAAQARARSAQPQEPVLQPVSTAVETRPPLPANPFRGSPDHAPADADLRTAAPPVSILLGSADI